MKKCVIMPDSFKGTMSAAEASRIMEESVREAFPECEIIAAPAADGGEGTVDCFLSALGKGKKVMLMTKGPFMDEVQSFFGVADGLGIVEMAASSGLDLAKGRLDPAKASTYGAGELVLAAIERGCNMIALGLGGSCTNDCGAGMAAALGTKFYDETGKTFIPVGGTLDKVVHIDVSETAKRLKGVHITAMCDIDNPLYGENGAAYVFAPQKGADQEKVELLDRNLRRFARTVQNSLGVDISGIKGAGAAGGAGAGAYAFFGAELQRGIDAFLDIVRFEEMIKGCDCIFTGEGRLDAQSLGGKAAVGIARRAKTFGVPVIAVTGTFEGSAESMKREGVSRIFETCVGRCGMGEIKKHCRGDLKNTMKEICKKYSLMTF